MTEALFSVCRPHRLTAHGCGLYYFRILEFLIQGARDHKGTAGAEAICYLIYFSSHRPMLLTHVASARI